MCTTFATWFFFRRKIKPAFHLYSHSCFLSRQIKVITWADLLEAELMGVNHLVNSWQLLPRHLFLFTHIVLRRCFSVMCLQIWSVCLVDVTLNKLLLLMISDYVGMLEDSFVVFMRKNWLVAGKLWGQFWRCHDYQCLFVAAWQFWQ